MRHSSGQKRLGARMLHSWGMNWGGSLTSLKIMVAEFAGPLGWAVMMARLPFATWRVGVTVLRVLSTYGPQHFARSVTFSTSELLSEPRGQPGRLLTWVEAFAAATPGVPMPY